MEPAPDLFAAARAYSKTQDVRHADYEAGGLVRLAGRPSMPPHGLDSLRNARWLYGWGDTDRALRGVQRPYWGRGHDETFPALDARILARTGDRPARRA